MCLIINKSIKPKKTNKDGFCIGWKVVSKDNASPFKWIVKNNSHQYKLGNNIDKNYIQTNHEMITFGFHVCLSRKAAKDILTYVFVIRKKYDGEKVIRVYYRPEDVIGYGISNMYNGNWGLSKDSNPKAVAVRALTIKSLKGLK